MSLRNISVYIHAFLLSAFLYTSGLEIIPYSQNPLKRLIPDASYNTCFELKYPPSMIYSILNPLHVKIASKIASKNLTKKLGIYTYKRDYSFFSHIYNSDVHTPQSSSCGVCRYTILNPISVMHLIHTPSPCHINNPSPTRLIQLGIQRHSTAFPVLSRLCNTLPNSHILCTNCSDFIDHNSAPGQPCTLAHETFSSTLDLLTNALHNSSYDDMHNILLKNLNYLNNSEKKVIQTINHYNEIDATSDDDYNLLMRICAIPHTYCQTHNQINNDTNKCCAKAMSLVNLLSQYKDLNTVSSNGNTAILLAIKNNHHSIIENLIYTNKLHIRDRLRQFLQNKGQFNENSFVNFLMDTFPIEHVISCVPPQFHKNSEVQKIISSNIITQAKRLIAQNPVQKEKYIQLVTDAINTSNIPVLNSLMLVLDPQESYEIFLENKSFKEKNTFLLLALNAYKANNTDKGRAIFKILLDAGLDINGSIDEKQNTLAHYVICDTGRQNNTIGTNHTNNLLQLLLDFNHQFNIANQTGITVLHMASF